MLLFFFGSFYNFKYRILIYVTFETDERIANQIKDFFLNVKNWISSQSQSLSFTCACIVYWIFKHYLLWQGRSLLRLAIDIDGVCWKAFWNRKEIFYIIIYLIEKIFPSLISFHDATGSLRVFLLHFIFTQSFATI